MSIKVGDRVRYFAKRGTVLSIAKDGLQKVAIVNVDGQSRNDKVLVSALRLEK